MINTSSTWIADTSNGRYRVKTKSSVDDGQLLSLEQWAEDDRVWVLVTGAEELRSPDQLAQYIDLASLTEVPEVEKEYSWSILSALWQVRNGLASERTDSAFAYLSDKLENGSAAETSEISTSLLEAVKVMYEKRKA